MTRLRNAVKQSGGHATRLRNAVKQSGDYL